MGYSGSVIDILIYAAVAVFLLFRLRAVLGRRTGEERERPNPFERPPVSSYRPGLAEPGTATVTPFRPATAAPVIDVEPSGPLSLDARLARVAAADPSFDEKHFLAGAKSAFQMIVQAYAAGDLATLRPLLTSQLYGDFGRAISERRERNELAPVEFEGPVAAEIEDARVSPREIQIQVRFASRQKQAGETAPEDEIVDLWTFSRDPSSRDPNWQLVETTTPD